MKEYIVDHDAENQRGGGHEQVKHYILDASLGPNGGRRAMATPVVGDGEGVAAGHTRIERHLSQGYSRYVTYLAVSREPSAIVFLPAFA
jgi:hypothetical protein